MCKQRNYRIKPETIEGSSPPKEQKLFSFDSLVKEIEDKWNKQTASWICKDAQQGDSLFSPFTLPEKIMPFVIGFFQAYNCHILCLDLPSTENGR